VTVIASEALSFVRGGGGALVFKNSKRGKKAENSQISPEQAKEVEIDSSESSSPSEDSSVMKALSTSDRVFTWKSVDYTIPYGNGELKLLNGVNGYARPGVMIALMGASGAGKTTLLNTLAQRQKIGVVKGEMLVDGRPLDPDFQRRTGFCEQMDLHDETSTIREALEFSAILRQDRGVPRQEKIEYVDSIIRLLELDDIQDAIISSLGVEQKKRVTIGVELAAKPSLLLFLDEPTSGLDSQAAFSIVRFLKKLAKAGQAIVCTIHQPSSILIQQFDMILALNPGGNAFYFGPVGENGETVTKYFADRGAICPPSKNIAEFILETAAKPVERNGKRINWNDEWQKSEQNRELIQEIDQINEARSQIPPPAKGEQHEFAAPVTTQTAMLTRRLFLQYWREPSYYYGKIFVSVTIGIFNGFVSFNGPYSLLERETPTIYIFC
jgi:ATP-binding cassette, subfamily G (WHITE), member 2, SNQ2